MVDLLTGADTFNELALLQKNVSRALSESGFGQRKWGTNSQRLRDLIPQASKQISHLLADGDHVRTLGTIWHTNHDWLSIAVNFDDLPNKLTNLRFVDEVSFIQQT